MPKVNKINIGFNPSTFFLLLTLAVDLSKLRKKSEYRKLKPKFIMTFKETTRQRQQYLKLLGM